MKNTTKLKVIVLSLLMLIGLIPLTSFAQSDAFIFNEGDVFGRDAWTFTVNTQNFGATPVGSGLLILGIAGASYAVAKRRRSKRDIRKGTALLLAGLMLVGMTNCRKKVDTIASVGEKVHITVKVNGGGKAGVNPANGEITFNDGDYLYVGYDGAKVGELTYSTGSSSFGGDITISQSGDQPLYFYYLGGPAATVVDATHYTNISDQTGNYPVIATGPSTTNYEDGTKAYTVNLANKCGFVKFATNVNSSTVTVGGMNTKATLDFSDGTITPGTTGTVSFSTDGEGTGWAILLVQDAVNGATVTASGYSDGTCDVPAVTNNMLYSTGVGVSLTPAATSGLFTINSSGDQVCFAPGNLQYKSGEGWRFAEHQYDVIGSWDTSDWVDLFGWGTWGEGKNPLNESTNYEDYQWSTDFQGTLDGYNDWFTLSKDQWQYILGHSTMGWSSVAGVNGYVIRPDGNTTAVSSSYTAEAWAVEEAAGSVFLPAAGGRYGDYVYDVGNYGYYWSGTPYVDYYAWYLYFTDYGADMDDGDRSDGYSVRLVRHAN